MTVIKIVAMPGVGVEGPQGPTGKSAYQTAVDNGFEGTEQEWVDSLSGSADIADFTFEIINEGDESVMTIANHDMTIKTTRTDDNTDADISIESADDIWIRANGDDLSLYAANEIRFNTGDEVLDPMTYIDGTITLPNRTQIFDAADNVSIDRTITINADTNVLGQTPDTSGSGVVLAWSQDGYDLAQAFATGRAASGTVTFGDNSSVAITYAYDTIYESYPAIIYQWEPILPLLFPVTVNATFDDTEFQRSLNIQLINTSGNDNPTANWRFDNDGTLNLPAGSPKIINNAVPGDITLSAYNGVKVEASPGFGLESAKIDTNGLFIQDAGQLYEDSNLIIESNAGYPIIIQGHQDVNIESRNGNIILNPDGSAYIGNSSSENNRIARISDITAGSTGDITFVNNTISSETGDDIVIQNKSSDNTVKARIVLDQSNEQVLVEAINSNTEWFYSSQWSSAVWSGNGIQFTDAIDVYNFFVNTPGNVTGISVNDGTPMEWWGASFGEGTVSLNVSGTPLEDPTTVTEMRVYYNISSKVDIDYDNGSFDIQARGMSMDISSDDDTNVTAGGDDLRLRAWDDIFFTSNYNRSGATEHNWSMDSNGALNLPGSGSISNPSNSSGDGYGSSTLEIIPDSNLLFESSSNQYIVLDPTTPNHIHIRAGGVQDASTADLFLGAERTNINVSDGSGDVRVTSKRNDLNNSYINLNPDSTNYFMTTTDSITEPNAVVNVDGLDYAVVNVQYDVPNVGYKMVEITGGVFTSGQNYTFRVADGENNWTFDSNGTLYGPAMGGLIVSSLNGEEDNPLSINASGAISLVSQYGNINMYMDGAAYIGDAENDNRIVTVGDLNSAITTAEPDEVSFTVNGGTSATQPTFNGAPLFSGTYIKTGPMVHFQIQVDMDNITSFGTGQYYVDLPFDSKYGYQFKEGCLHHIATSNQYAIGGHVAAGTNRLYLTYTGSNGQDEMFDYNSPVTLAVTDNFHIAGTYIAGSN